MSHKPDRDFLYILKRKDTGDYIYIDSSGAMAYTSTPTALVYTPEGWQKKSIAWDRDIKKFGLVRSFTLPLEFVEDGATIVSELSLDSIETPLQLIIQQLELIINGTIPQTHDWVYVDLYIGEPDLSKVEGSEDRIKAPMIEGGIEQQVKANENTVYEFDFDNYVSPKLDGIILAQTGNFLLVDGIEITKSQYSSFFYMPVSHINTDGNSTGIAFFTQELQAASSNWLTLTSSLNYFAWADKTNPASIDLTIKKTIEFKCTKNDFAGGFRGRFIRSNQAIANQNDYQVFAVPTLIVGTIYSFPVNITIPLQPGETLFFEGVFFGGATGAIDIGIEFLPGSDMTVGFKNKYKTSSCKSFRPFALFQKLIEKMTGSAANADSALLLANPNITITSGDAVRGIIGAKLKTSFAEFMEFCRTQFVAGYEIKAGKVVIDTIENICSVATPLDLGECKNFKWNFAVDLMFNSIKIGYPQKDTDDVNGKFSFNNTHVWNIPGITKVTTSLDIICPYVSDPYYIELTRLNLEGKLTTDNSADNDVMLLNVEDIAPKSYTASFGTFLSGNIVQLTNGFPDINLFETGAKFTVTGSVSNNGTFTILSSFKSGTNDLWIFVQEAVVAEGPVTITISYGTVILKRVTYTNTDTGVPEIATLFNIEFLTPHRMLLRWLKYINSSLFQFAGQSLQFQSTEKNRELKTNDGITIIDEDAAITIGTTIFFKAIYLNLTSVVPSVMPITLQATPNVGFSTIWNGITWIGILFKGAMAPNTLQEQNFMLLAGPATDESLLRIS